MASISDTVNQILGVTVQHESGGNWGAVNRRTKAYGAFQIMPSNWAPWCREAGLPANAPKTRENQIKVARHKMTEYVGKYGVKGAFAAWYGGPVNGYRYSHGYSTDAKGRPWTARNGNGSEESIQSYVNTQWANFQKNGGSADGYLTGLGSADLDNYGQQRESYPMMQTIDTTPMRSPMTRFLDSLEDGVLDQGMNSAVRYAWSWIPTMAKGNAIGIPGISPKYTPTPQDIEYVKKLLPGDAEAQNFVLNSAYSADHMYMLAAMKKEDYDREQRLAEDASHEEWNVAGTFGNIAGSLIDPITVAMVVGSAGEAAPAALEAKGATALALKGLSKLKAIGRLGEALYKFSPFAEGTIERLGFNALKGAAVVGTDRYLAKQWGGFKPNYASNMLMGTALGSAYDAFRFAKKLTGKSYSDTPVGKVVVPKLLKIENNVISVAMDKRPELLKRVTDMRTPEQTHLDIDRLAKKDSSIYSKLEELKDVKFLSHREAKKIAEKEFVPFSTKTKVFMIPKTGEIVAVGDRIRSPKALDKVVNSVRIMKSEDIQDAVAEGRTNAVVATLKGNGYGEREADEIVSSIDSVEKSKKAPLIAYPDGSARVNGVDFDADNPFNPVTETKWLQGASEVEKDMQGDLPKWLPKSLGKYIEAGYPFKTIFGELGNSRVTKVRELGNRLFADPRMRGKLNEYQKEQILPAESIALNIKRALATRLDPYYDLRKKWTNSKGHSILNRQYSKYFDKQVVDCYNMKYGGQKSKRGRVFDPEVNKAADVLKDTRDAALEFARETARMHGGNINIGSLVDEDWIPVDDEFSRRIDNDALCDILNRYFDNDRDAAIKELTRYGTVACDVKKLTAKEQRAADMKYARAMKEYEQGRRTTKPKKVKISEADVEKTIPERAAEWARGIIDKNQSRVAFGGGELGVDPVTFLRSRFPMDTGITLPLHAKDGTPFNFNFDEMIRDTDVDRIMQSYIQRMSGEIAVHDVLGKNWRTESKLLQDAHVGLNKAADTVGSGMSRADVNGQRDTIKEGLSRILGTNIDFDNPQSSADAFSNLLRTKAYADVGGQMWLNQLGEFGSAMGYAGVRVLPKSIPIVRDVRKAFLSHSERELEDTASIIRDHMFGKDIARRTWTRISSYESRAFRDTMAKASETAKALDKVQDTFNFFSNITSTLNQLPNLTDLMVRQGQEAGIVDSVKWAKGEKFKFRKPFSDKALKAVGVTTKRETEALKQSVSKYLNLKNFDTWREKDPTNYFRWRQLVENYSRRTIQQLGVGDTPLLKEKNWFTKLLFQFKDYTFRAVNSQTMRALTSRQRDDFFAALYSMGTNCLSYMGLVYLRAYARYPSDAEARKEYIDKQLTPGRLAWAAFSRGALTGSIPSFGSDAYEIWTGTPMMRTTVNHSYGSNNGMAPSDVLGRVVGEMPAISSVLDPAYYGWEGTKHALESGLTKEDANSIAKIFPLNAWLGFTLASSMINDELDLPTRKEVDEQNKAEQEMNEALTNQQESLAQQPSEADQTALDKIMEVR